MGKGKADVGKMDAILTEITPKTLDLNRCILTKVIMPKIEYVEVWEGSAKFVKHLETVQMTAARKVLLIVCSTSNTVSRAELGMYPIKTNTGVRKLKGQYKIRAMQKKKVQKRCQPYLFGLYGRK